MSRFSITFCMMAFFVMCAFTLQAQHPRGGQRQGQGQGYGYGYSQQPPRQQSFDYPLKSHLLGFMGGAFITSNPELGITGTKKNYLDWGGGIVYDYRNEVTENYSFEYVLSAMLTSAKTSYVSEEESKCKVIIPMETRWYLGSKDFKVYLGVGLQYNFLWTVDWGDKDDMGTTGAHQLGGNGSLGVTFFGIDKKVHLLVGAKVHVPIINNSEGIEYSNSTVIDFSKDKTCVSATAGISFDLGRSCVWMFNYDYPLGSNMQVEVGTEDNRNFFERRSQSLTTSFLFRL